MELSIGIVTLRKKFKVKQKDLAKACGISVSALSSIERGRYNPSKETIYKICDFFKIPLISFTFHCITPEDFAYLSSGKQEIAINNLETLQKIVFEECPRNFQALDKEARRSQSTI